MERTRSLSADKCLHFFLAKLLYNYIMTIGQFFSSLFTIPAPVAGVLGPILSSIGQVWSATWWFFTPIILAIIFWDGWKLYLHVRFVKSIKWVVLEIKVPKDVLKTPKAMEQIFAAAHTPYSYGFRKYDIYVKGAEEDFMSFELVGRAGETHFYLRVPTKLRNLMESSIFGQYPNAEIVEVEDYLHELPHVLPNDDIDVGGFEEIFSKPDFYPLRTYTAFEEPVEEQRIDPIAQLVEAMSKMEGDQQFWFQLIVEPTGEDWVKKGEAAINKIHGLEEKKEHKPSLLPNFDLGITAAGALRAPFQHPGEAAAHKKEEKPTKQVRTVLTAQEKIVTEGIANKISKFGLRTTIRFMFIGRKGDKPSADDNMRFAHGYMRQFNTQNMNALRPNKAFNSAAYTVRGMFKRIRLGYRKRIMYERYTHISQDHHAPILSIEELATLYHFPITAVTTTQLEKIESKKGAPPASLPVMEDEAGVE